MKKIRIAFTDFWDVFDPHDNFIMDALSENFDVELSDDPEFVFCSIFGRKRSELFYGLDFLHYSSTNLL